MSATIVPIGTLLVWLCAAVLALGLVAGVMYLVIHAVTSALAGIARASTATVAAASRLATRAVSSAVPARPAGAGGSAPASSRSNPSAPRWNLAPLVDALAHASALLADGARHWIETAGGDQSTAPARRRALAEMAVLGIFWLLATGADLQLTYARLAGSSASLALAYASAGTDVTWLFALVIVANVGVGAAFWFSVAHAPGSTPLVAAADEARMRRVVAAFLVASAIAAVALSLAAQEEVDGIHDMILWNLFYGMVALCLVGALWLGGVVGWMLIALSAAVGCALAWLPVAGAHLALRVVQGRPAPVSAPGTSVLIGDGTAPPTPNGHGDHVVPAGVGPRRRP